MLVASLRIPLITGEPARTRTIPVAAKRASGRHLLHLVLLTGLGLAGCNGDDSDAKQDVLPGDLEEDFWRLSEAAYQFEVKLCDCGDWSCLPRLSEARWQAEMQCVHDGSLKHPELLREYVDCWLPILEQSVDCAKEADSCAEITEDEDPDMVTCSQIQQEQLVDCADPAEELLIEWEQCPNLTE